MWCLCETIYIHIYNLYNTQSSITAMCCTSLNFPYHSTLKSTSVIFVNTDLHAKFSFNPTVYFNSMYALLYSKNKLLLKINIAIPFSVKSYPTLHSIIMLIKGRIHKGYVHVFNNIYIYVHQYRILGTISTYTVRCLSQNYSYLEYKKQAIRNKLNLTVLHFTVYCCLDLFSQQMS